MAVEIITREDLNQFRMLLLKDINEILNSKPDHSKKWLSANEVKEQLNISSGTLQNFRIKGILTHTKIGSSVFYSTQEIEKILESNKVKSFNSIFK